VTAVAVRARHRPVWALHVLVVGLALHNVVLAELWDAGVHGNALDVVSAWKDALLLVALVLAIRARGRIPFDGVATDWLALAFGAFVIGYALLPQSWLGGDADAHGILLGLRHDGLPVAAYFLGRALDLTRRELRGVFTTILATGAVVAAVGLADVYAIPLQWWRDSGAPGWFGEQLGFGYLGLSGLPENYVYNTGNEEPLRRLVSTFLSPLATSYLLVVALIVAVAWLARDRLRGRMLVVWIALSLLLFAGLLWTHSRSSYLALALGLVVFAVARRGSAAERLALVGAAFAVIAVGAAFVRAYPHIGPTTSFTRAELAWQRANAAVEGPAGGDISDASTESHWRSLREGIETVLRHPQGFGLGNAGSTASRTGVEIKAGESTYTELAVGTGLLGGLVFVAWSLALLWRVRRSAVIAASMAAVLALALQTDVIGVPWLVCVVWALAGSRVLPVTERVPRA
jgi:O-antigen ligase/polysaccharide polymerase Wzy-like membrane protein